MLRARSRVVSAPHWRAGTFKFSTDKELVAKIADIIGLYVAPPENAMVICVDEKVRIYRSVADQ